MRKIFFTIFLVLSYLWGYNQTYNPSQGTTSNKPYAPAQYGPTDSRSYFYDATNFVWRPYVDTNEVLTYLNLSKYRSGQVLYVVNTGGSLVNGVITGGTNALWYFKDGQADANLVRLNSGGSGAGTVTNVSSTPAAGITLTISNPTTTPNIVPSVTLGGDISGSTLSAVTVAKFNGLPPAYYTNYNNLTNTPTIPAQFNPIAGTGITLTGTYPNITIASSAAGFSTASVYLKAISSTNVGIDTANYRKVDTMYTTNDSTLKYTLNGNLYSLQIRGGVGAGGGGGSGTVTNVSGVNANGVSFSITNPTSTPAITITLGAITPTTVNGLTLAQAANSFTITGGTGTPRTLTLNAGNANVSGTNTGDVTLTGTPTYITIAGQVITRNLINLTTDVTGILPAANFPALTGPVTTSAGSLATTITNGAVTYAKIQNETSQTFLGRYAAGSGVVQEGTLAPYFAFNSSTGLLTLSGVASVTGGDLIVGLSSNTFTALAKNTSPTRYLANTGSSSTPNWDQVNLTNGVQGLLPLGNGGNGTATPTVTAGYGILLTGSWGNYTVALDTAGVKDTVFVQNAGSSGLSLAFQVNSSTIGIKKLVAGANISLTQNSDSSITITSTGGGGGGGISLVGAFDSQSPSTDGAVISGSSIYFQSASSTKPGMMNTVAQTIAGAKSYSAAPNFLTLTTNGGVFWGNASGTLLQSNSGTTVQVLHGGTYPSNPPSFSSLVLTTDVTGILPIANGGNGTATPTISAGAGISIAGTWNNYTITATTLGTVTSISGSGGTTGLTLTGGPITTSGTLTLGGTLVPANGGTGLSSLTPFAVLAGGSTATGTFQQVSGVGTTGQVLTSNGAGQLPSWQVVTASGSVSTDVSQTYSSGSTVTVSNGTNVLYVDPASTQAALTVTLPATPHNGNYMWIHFGGTLTSGSVITSFSVVGNTGQTIMDNTPFAGNLATTDITILYKWRSGTNQWYRVKP